MTNPKNETDVKPILTDAISKPTKPKPMFYAYCLSLLQDKAKELGYNLIIHGSMNRDCDLVAVAWVDNPSPSIVLINELNKIIRGNNMIEYAGEEVAKQHFLYSKLPGNREAYVINLNRGGYKNDSTEYEKDPEYYLDISVVNNAALTRELEEAKEELYNKIINEIEAAADPFNFIDGCRIRPNNFEIMKKEIRNIINESRHQKGAEG